MSSGGFTLGHLMIAMAAVEVVVVVLMGMSMSRSDLDLPPEQRRPAALIVGAGIAAAIGLALLGLYWPMAQMIIF
ncbi:MAG TPA: hypothetical protein VEA77_04875 [Hyphomicrobium sp.]|nr:hypothetical protein [Hyphomicrobium sp.]